MARLRAAAVLGLAWARAARGDGEACAAAGPDGARHPACGPPPSDDWASLLHVAAGRRLAEPAVLAPGSSSGAQSSWTALDLAKAWMQYASEYKDDCKYALAVAYNEGAQHICHKSDDTPASFCYHHAGQLCTSSTDCGGDVAAFTAGSSNIFQITSLTDLSSLQKQVEAVVAYVKGSCAASGVPKLFADSSLDLCGCEVGGTVGEGWTGRCEHDAADWYSISVPYTTEVCNQATAT